MLDELLARFHAKDRLALARLLTRKAVLWVLDEPFTALDAGAVEVLSSLIATHLADGGLAVLTSHQAIPIDQVRALQL